MSDTAERRPRAWYDREDDPLEILFRDVQKICSERGYVIEELRVSSLRRPGAGPVGEHIMRPRRM